MNLSLCVCGLLVATLSAMAADVDTTRQFTARGVREINPLARPFVEGRGGRGEAVVAVASGAAWIWVSQAPEPWRSLAWGLGWVVHATLAVRHGQIVAAEVPVVMAPVVVVRW